jgi:protein-S-isoprenylcysteine O-methyltransferase Ste14
MSRTTDPLYWPTCGAVICALLSVYCVLAAIKTLGKQWNVRASLVENHRLVTTGPYAVVRHPIYLGMLGLLVATGFAIAQWEIVVIGIACATSGAVVRIRAEAHLLRTQSGQGYDDYCRRVSALIPWIFLVIFYFAN